MDIVGMAAEAGSRSVFGTTWSYDSRSAVGQAATNNTLNYSEYYTNTVANAATLGGYGLVTGVAEFGGTAYGWWNGTVSDDKMSEAFADAGANFLLAAGGLKVAKALNGAGQLTLTEAAQAAGKNFRKLAKDLLADERGEIPDPLDALLRPHAPTELPPPTKSPKPLDPYMQRLSDWAKSPANPNNVPNVKPPSQNRVNPSVPAPEVPPNSLFGRSFQDFGRDVIGWGTGAREAAARLQSITLQELQRGGVTVAQAQAARDFYAGVLARNPGNTAAAARVQLMDRILQLLEGS